MLATPLEALDSLIAASLINSSSTSKPGHMVLNAPEKIRILLRKLKSCHTQTMRLDACFNCFTQEDILRIQHERQERDEQQKQLQAKLQQWYMEDFALGAKLNGRL